MLRFLKIRAWQIKKKYVKKSLRHGKRYNSRNNDFWAPKLPWQERGDFSATFGYPKFAVRLLDLWPKCLSNAEKCVIVSTARAAQCALSRALSRAVEYVLRLKFIL